MLYKIYKWKKSVLMLTIRDNELDMSSMWEVVRSCHLDNAGCGNCLT